MTLPEVPLQARHTIDRLEMEMLAIQLRIANLQAQFRIVELETLADLGLSPREYRIERTGDQIRIMPRRDNDTTG